MANVSTSQKSKGIEINIFGFLKELSRKIWVVVLVAVIFATGGGIVSKLTTHYTYTSSVSFIVNTLTENEMAGSSAISAQINMADTFRYILSGRVIKEAVAEACPANVTYKVIDSSIVVETVPDTNVVELSVVTEDADLSYAIAKTVVEVYGDIVSDIYSNAKLTICDTPIKATTPTADRSTSVIVISAAFVSALLMVFIFFIMYLIKDTVKSATELGAKLDIPVLASVQQVSNKSKLEKGLLITDKRTGFSFIETYKAIRTKIVGHTTKTGDKVYLITSACENEGKTTVSVNLALSIAETGKSVLLIDADLRNPSISKMLALPESGTGFSDVIKGSATLSDTIKYVNNFNIYVLCNQVPISNPSELLSMDTTEKIVESLRDEFDYIFIDSPPASLVTDTSIMARHTDSSIIVVREDYAPFSRIRMSVEDIDSNGSEIIGCIFNVDSSASVKRNKYGKMKYGKYSRYYGYGKYGSYGYGSYGGYGYGYGYGSKSKKKS